MILTRDLLYRLLEIERTGSLIIPRNVIGSAVEHIELFQEARVWATVVIRLRHGGPGFRGDNLPNIRAGLSNQL